MIRINLLKQPAARKTKKRKLSLRFFIIPGSVIGFAVVCVGLWWTLKTLALFSAKEKAQEVVRDDYTPSTFASTQAVEDVVVDVTDAKDKLSRRGLLKLHYNEFSILEKINYEIHFAKNVCDLLGKAVFPGVDFTAIKVHSFNTMQGTGVTRSKEDVVRLFEALRREHFELLPKPDTKITSREGGFAFVVECRLELPLNLEDPFLIDADNVADRDDLDMLVKRVVDVAKEAGVQIGTSPSFLASSSEDDYRLHRYHITGRSSYTTFTAFINSLYARRIPCAFEMFKLTALNSTTLKIEADIIFTTKK